MEELVVHTFAKIWENTRECIFCLYAENKQSVDFYLQFMCCVITSKISEISERSTQRNATFTKWKKTRNQQEVGYTCPQSWIIPKRHRRYWDQGNQQLAWHITTDGEWSEIIGHVVYLPTFLNSQQLYMNSIFQYRVYHSKKSIEPICDLSFIALVCIINFKIYLI